MMFDFFVPDWTQFSVDWTKNRFLSFFIHSKSVALLRCFYFDKSWKWNRRLACSRNHPEQLVQKKKNNGHGRSYVWNFDSRYFRATIYHCFEPWFQSDSIFLWLSNSAVFTKTNLAFSPTILGFALCFRY